MQVVRLKRGEASTTPPTVFEMKQLLWASFFYLINALQLKSSGNRQREHQALGK